jgi:hypothetical protein
MSTFGIGRKVAGMSRLLLAALAAALLTLALAVTASADCPTANCGPSGTYTTPATSVTDGPSDPTGDRTPTFTFGSTLSFSRFECRWSSSDPWFACASGYTPAAQADGAYTLTVRACKDYEDPEFGTEIVKCDETPAARSYRVDTTGPTAGFAAGPASGARLNTAPSYTFSGAVNPFSKQYRCAITTPELHDCGETVTVIATNLVDGEYTVRVRTPDDWGNWGPVATRTFIWDTTAPAVTVGGPGATNDTTPELSWTAPGDGGAQYATTCLLDAATIPCANGTIPIATALGDGEHTVTVRARDEAGNSGEDTHTITVDTRAPAISDQAWDAGARRLTFDVDEPATLRCAVDEGTMRSCSSPWSPGTLAAGNHVLSVRATDAAGNESVATLGVTIPRPPAGQTPAGTAQPGGGGTPAPPAAAPPTAAPPAPRAAAPVISTAPNRTTTRPKTTTKKRSTCAKAKRKPSKKARASAKKKKRSCATTRKRRSTKRTKR